MGSPYSGKLPYMHIPPLPFSRARYSKRTGFPFWISGDSILLFQKRGGYSLSTPATSTEDPFQVATLALPGFRVWGLGLGVQVFNIGVQGSWLLKGMV